MIEDEDACNVLLLGYHNGKEDLNGFPWIFLDVVVESWRGNISESYKENWSELKYIQYSPDMDVIRKSAGGYKADNMKTLKSNLPNFHSKIRQCDDEIVSAAFYPLEGVKGSIGLIVVLYKEHKVYPANYYENTIAMPVQHLISILNCNN